MRLRTFVRNTLFQSARLFGRRCAGCTEKFSWLIRSSAFHHAAKTPSYPDRYALYRKINELCHAGQTPIVYLEFGVAGGKSFRWWMKHQTDPLSVFIGFDTFTGLPEDWGKKRRGHFSTGGVMPSIDDSRAIFAKGLFQDTLPRFIDENKDLLAGRKVINLDADLYSSTLYVLTTLRPFLKYGDILIFDEMFSLTKSHTEFRAFMDFLSFNPLNYSILGKTLREMALMVEP